VGIPKELVNCKITLIERVARAGPGGDVSATTVVEKSICAIREPFNAFASAADTINRTLDTAGKQADTTFWIDIEDAEFFRDVRAGDLVTWESTRKSVGGPIGVQHEILRLLYWEAPGLTREHIEMFTVGQADGVAG